MFVARELGAKYPECKAVHLNFNPVPLPEHLNDADLMERERRANEKCEDWLNNHLGYAVCMRSRPHTIGVAIVENPVGIMMWVGEKYDELCNPLNQDEIWEDAILTRVSLYYFSRCAMTSMLPYYENVKHHDFGEFLLKKENWIKCPLGYTSFFYDSRPGTKRGAERSGNLVFYNGTCVMSLVSRSLALTVKVENDDGGSFCSYGKPRIDDHRLSEVFWTILLAIRVCSL